MNSLLRTLTILALAAAPFWATAAESTPATPAAPAAEAAKTPPPPPAPTLEQRIAGLEAYLGNGDPSAVLKDAKGAIPAGLTTAAASSTGPGHNGFMMICAALVLFMTLPGLFLFYGGLVRSKNVLSVIAQCFGLAGLVTILWWAVGYSLVFGKSFDGTLLGHIFGGSEFFFMNGVTSAPNTDYAYWISQNVFSMFQLMFAIITPALIVGAVAERMKFSALMAFMTAWMFLVYFPMAHAIWGISGDMNGVWNARASIKAIDFAGGTVVHMTSGWSALLLCIILGPRIGFGKKSMSPHSMVLCAVGTGMLWVGWYGFNAGSALASDGVAAQAFTTTTLAAAVAAFTWGALEWVLRKHASVLGICSGAVAGLVVVTPAAGFVSTTSAVIIGVLAGVVPFLAVVYLKSKLGYDDALDTFGVHAVGGTLGAVLTGIFATIDANANLGLNLKDVVGNTLLTEQFKAIGVTLALSLVATAIIAYTLKATIGLRPTEEDEARGLDISDHGEEGYNHNS
ncbi:MAG: ammonia channel protein [Opitutia bacterium Tous-C2FEB]|nr:MAG: ammonia channel protein [Opitutae bacterium Tous-C2FEB]